MVEARNYDCLQVYRTKKRAILIDFRRKKRTTKNDQITRSGRGVRRRKKSILASLKWQTTIFTAKKKVTFPHQKSGKFSDAYLIKLVYTSNRTSTYNPVAAISSEHLSDEPPNPP